jgi:hypothetical protein
VLQTIRWIFGTAPLNTAKHSISVADLINRTSQSAILRNSTSCSAYFTDIAVRPFSRFKSASDLVLNRNANPVLVSTNSKLSSVWPSEYSSWCTQKSTRCLLDNVLLKHPGSKTSILFFYRRGAYCISKQNRPTFLTRIGMPTFEVRDVEWHDGQRL